MEPTLGNPELILINKQAYASGSPKRFDIVAIFDPVTNEMLVKRIVGLPGERVEIVNGEIYINNTYLKYPFSSEKVDSPYYNVNSVILSSNSYFYIGDARKTSSMGVVLSKQLMGKIIN